MAASDNRLDVALGEGEEWYIRTGCFLRHPDYEVAIPQKFSMPLKRLQQRMMFFFRVKEQEFTLTTPYADAHLVKINIPEGDALIVKMGHVLAFSSNTFFQKAWRFGLCNFVSLRFRFVYLPGPASVVLFGLGDLHEEKIVNETKDYDRGSTIGWTNSLAHGVSTRSSPSSALLGHEQVCLDRFKGTGAVITQASTIRKLPKRFHDEKAKNSILDYFSAILGLGA